MANFPQNGHVGNVRLELISVHQTIKGDPNNGLDELEPIRSYLIHFPTLYSKLLHFPIEILIKNENG